MRTKKPWLTLLALLAALSLIAAACGDDEGDATDTGGGGDTEETTEADPGDTETTMAEEGTETTMAEEPAEGEMMEPVGEACSAIPADGEGSSAGMADDTAGTAASNNPVLSTLVDAVTAADLVDALNDPEAEYTIFAPANDAFEAIPAEDMQGVMADTEMLTNILTYHVFAEGKMDLAQLQEAGELTMLNGDTVTLEGEGDTLTVNGEAMVVCGNVTTSNATVHIIDSVLMPPA